MIIQRTLLNQIEVTADAIQVRLELCVFNGDTQVSSRWHRVAVPYDAPAGAGAEQFEAVNLHLAAMGELPVSAEDIAKIEAHYQLAKGV